jgi:hypothetical protein
MKLPTSRLPLVTLGALAAGATLAVALPAGAAVSVQSESAPVKALSLGDTARLDAKGAVVFTPMTVTCMPGRTAYLSVGITQSIGSGIATGAAGREVPCTGTPQEIQVSVTPADRAFHIGTAYGEASALACNRYGCSRLFDEHVIRIVR